MDYGDKLFVSLELWQSNKTEVLERASLSSFSDVVIVVPYDQREIELTPNTEKAILLTTPNQAQNYTLIKRGKTNAGEVSLVIYQPDFSLKTIEQDIRKICEKGWCDAILNLEQNPQKDGLHKKKHYFTQVEAKFVAENSITLFFTQSNLIAPNAFPFILNRVNQIVTIGSKYDVVFNQITFAQSLDEIKSHPHSSLLDVLSRKTI